MAALALGRAAETAAGGWRDEFVVRFQQTCGPVMAKGVEDTAFYRWSRLVALNEVGGEPDSPGTEPEAFHEFAARLSRDWPATMTTLSTHDTKRQEDVRARLAVLAEIPQEWAAEVARWHDAAAALSGGGRRAGAGAERGRAQSGGGTGRARGRDRRSAGAGQAEREGGESRAVAACPSPTPSTCCGRRWPGPGRSRRSGPPRT